MATPELTGRTAVVTGGASGIGRATALLLAERGARVFAGDLQSPHADDPLPEEIVFTACDVRVCGDLERLVETAVAATGRLDIMVNNAGIGMVKQIDEVSEADWDACLDTNLKGPFFGCKAAIRRMRAGGGGAIVNTASNAGLLPRAHDPVYSISKHAVVALTKSLALCHACDRIRINCVCPGPVGDTGMINADLAAAADPAAEAEKLIAASPLARAWGRMVTPSEVAEAILYLVSDESAMVTGTAIAIDGGKSLGVPPKM